MPIIDNKGKNLNQNEVDALKEMISGAIDGHLDYMKECKEETERRDQSPEFYDPIIACYERAKSSLSDTLDRKIRSRKKIKAEEFVSEFFSDLSKDISNNIDHNSKAFRYFSQSVAVSLGDLNIMKAAGLNKAVEMFQDKKESYDNTANAFKFATEPMEGIEDIEEYNPDKDSVMALYSGRAGNSTTLKKGTADDVKKGIFGLHVGAETSRMHSSELMNKKNVTFADLYNTFSSLNQSLRPEDSMGGKIRGKGITAGSIVGVGGFKAPETLYKTLSTVADYMNQIKQVEDPALRKTRAVQLAAFAYQMTLSEHVFGDANGRTCRLFADTILQTFGLPPHTPNPEEEKIVKTLGFEMDFNKGAEVFLDGIKKSDNILKQEREKTLQNNKQENVTRQSLLEEMRRLVPGEALSENESQLYQKYASAIENLDRKMDELERPNEEGLAKDLDEKGKNELIEGFKNVALAGESFLAGAQENGKNLNKGIYKVVTRLQNMLSKDYENINSYDPKTPKTLREIQEDSRTITIDFRKRTLKKMGNRMSSRIPMTVYTSDGKKRTGVFTKASYANILGEYNSMIDKAKNKCNTQGAKALDNLLDDMKTYYVSHGRKKRDGTRIQNSDSREYIFGRMLIALRVNHDKRKKGRVTKSEIKNYFKKNTIDTTNISEGAFDILTKGMDNLLDSPGNEINAYSLGLKDNERIDQRNSAMSVVAGLFGSGDLLARSDSMKYIGEDGNEVEGTFMEFGKGADLIGDPLTCRHVSTNPYKDRKAKNRFLKSVADLQIIDFICGNVDRHRGNLLYQFDENGNVTGVQGIDNDSSFPKESNSEMDGENLKVISKSMSDKVNKITPEMLKFSLRGRGLSDEEISASVKRFTNLKDYIKLGKVKVVKDETFHRLTDEELTGTHQPNLFNQAFKAVDDAATMRHEYSIGFEPYEPNVPEFSKVSSTERRYIVGGLMDMTETIGRMLDNKETGFKVSDIDKAGRRSDEFTHIIEAARLVKNMPKQLKDNKMLDEKMFIHDAAAEKTIENVDSVFTNLKSEILTYLRKKTRQRGLDEKGNIKGKNEYEQKRIDYAKEMLKTVKEYEKIRKKPSAAAEIAEERKLIESRKQREKQKIARQPGLG